MTYDDMVLKHNEIKAYLEAEDAAHVERLKPYRDGMLAIEMHLLKELQTQKADHIKTEHGTAYQTTTMSVKVDNRDEFLQFITQQNKWDMLDARALKEPVKEWLGKSDGVPPPGLTVGFFTKCNIRRS